MFDERKFEEVLMFAMARLIFEELDDEPASGFKAMMGSNIESNGSAEATRSG